MKDGAASGKFPEYELAGIETIARGVCVVRGKVLLCRAKGAGTTYLPGGHIEFGETGREALVREVAEELGAESKAGRFLGVVENRFIQHGRPHAEINLLYELEIPALAGGEPPAAREDWIGFEWRAVDDLGDLLPADMRVLSGFAGEDGLIGADVPWRC